MGMGLYTMPTFLTSFGKLSPIGGRLGGGYLAALGLFLWARRFFFALPVVLLMRDASAALMRGFSPLAVDEKTSSMRTSSSSTAVSLSIISFLICSIFCAIP